MMTAAVLQHVEFQRFAVLRYLDRSCPLGGILGAILKQSIALARRGESVDGVAVASAMMENDMKFSCHEVVSTILDCLSIEIKLEDAIQAGIEAIESGG